jgi:hypothetical protein
MNSALRTQETLQQAEIEDGLGHNILGARLHFVLEAPDLFVHVVQSGVGADADYECRARANGVAANVETAIEVMNDVHQADRVHVKHRGGVGIAAHFRRIAGDADQVANARSRCSQQIRLNAQHVAVAAGVVQDGFNAHFLLDK